MKDKKFPMKERKMVAKKTILFVFSIGIAIMLISLAYASPIYKWYLDSSIISGLPTDLGDDSAIEIRYNLTGDEKWTAILWEVYTSSPTIKGYYWNGASWVEDSSRISGLPAPTSNSRTGYCSVYGLEGQGNWTIIRVRGDPGAGKGYYWNGSYWVNDDARGSGIASNIYAGSLNLGDCEIVKGVKDNNFTIFILTNNGIRSGYWNGTEWLRDDSRMTGLPKVYGIAIKNDITGDENWTAILGDFKGYYWNGTQWIVDSSRVEGLGTPDNLYCMDMAKNIAENNIWWLISGADNGQYYGYEWIGLSYLNNGVNSTASGQSTKFYIQYVDDTALHPSGQYIFSTNNTGTWVNESAVNFTTTPEWANVTKTLNSTVGTVVGYRWYAFNNVREWYNTPIYTLTVTTIPPSQPSLNFPQDDALDITTSPVLNITVTDLDSDIMNVSFYTSSDDLIGTVTNITNGSEATFKWYGRKTTSSYQWYANVTDGNDTTKGPIWNFSTKSNPDDCAWLWEGSTTYNLTADIIDANPPIDFAGTGYSTRYCIYLDASNITFDGSNHLIKTKGGVLGMLAYEENMGNSIIKNFRITGCEDPIKFYGSSYAIIENITTYGCSFGITLSYSSREVTIRNCTTHSQAHGLWFYLTVYNIDVYDNIFYNLTSEAISLRDYTYNSDFYRNKIYNSSRAIHINAVDGYVTNNKIYNNLFNTSNNYAITGVESYYNYLNTTNQTGTRIYSLGTQIGGNYWTNSSGDGYSDTCIDADSDGFCDDAYTLAAGNIDYLPLSFPAETTSRTIALILSVTESISKLAERVRTITQTLNLNVIISRTVSFFRSILQAVIAVISSIGEIIIPSPPDEEPPSNGGGADTTADCSVTLWGIITKNISLDMEKYDVRTFSIRFNNSKGALSLTCVDEVPKVCEYISLTFKDLDEVTGEVDFSNTTFDDEKLGFKIIATDSIGCSEQINVTINYEVEEAEIPDVSDEAEKVLEKIKAIDPIYKVLLGFLLAAFLITSFFLSAKLFIKISLGVLVCVVLSSLLL